MTLLCERCFGPIDPESERFYRLAHIAGADASGRVAWNHATVHSDPCDPAVASVDVGSDVGSDMGERRRAA